MSVDPKEVLDKIDVDELIKVTLDLANIDSPTGSEGPVADYVYDWLVREGFDARKLGLYPDRPNVLATLAGTGNGRSLCFNSHMDTTVHKDEWWATRHAADPIFNTGWREGDVLVVDTNLFADHTLGSYLGSGRNELRELPSGPQKHVVERYQLGEDGTRLVIDSVLEDPEYLAEPVTMSMEWDYAPNLPLLRFGCEPEQARRYLFR